MLMLVLLLKLMLLGHKLLLLQEGLPSIAPTRFWS